MDRVRNSFRILRANSEVKWPHQRLLWGQIPPRSHRETKWRRCCSTFLRVVFQTYRNLVRGRAPGLRESPTWATGWRGGSGGAGKKQCFNCFHFRKGAFFKNWEMSSQLLSGFFYINCIFWSQIFYKFILVAYSNILSFSCLIAKLYYYILVLKFPPNFITKILSH